MRLCGALLLIGLAVPAAASSLSIGVDPRVELLGVVQYLAGGRGAGAAIPAALEVEKTFGALRAHPAVKTYAAALKRGEESYGLILLLAGPPPELAPRRDFSLISQDFVAAVGGRSAVDEFLEQLRDFAAKSRFSEFYASRRVVYARLEERAKKGFPKDALARVEAYAGRDLKSRMSLILAVTYRPQSWREYIVPYPYGGPGRRVDGPFEVYAILPPVDASGGAPGYGLDKPFSFGVMNELLYVPVEQAYPDYGPGLERFSALEKGVAGDCPPQWDSCSKHIIVSALARRLERGADKTPRGPKPAKLDSYIDAVAARLGEYERDRKKYPTLDAFYPRIVDEFGKLAEKR